MKKKIRLTESRLNKIVRESVNKVLNESINPTAADKLRQCSSNLNHVLNTIKNDVIKTIDSLKDGDFKGYSKILNNFSYYYPQMINNCYKPIIDEYIKSNTVGNDKDFYEPEDWHERNEHGDFDTY